MTIMTIDEQVADMKRKWPGFRVVYACEYCVAWEGTLRPFDVEYKVRVAYTFPCYTKDFETGNFLRRYTPRVNVLSPEVQHIDPIRDEVTPHIYPEKNDRPALCLHDPETSEWTSHKSIAETIVPWTSTWLGCYELWQATGKWSARERHPDRPQETTPYTNKKNPAEAALFNTKEFVSLGQKIGTFASLPLMAAASAGFYPQHFFQKWGEPPLSARMPEDILTSSLVPPRASSSTVAGGLTVARPPTSMLKGAGKVFLDRALAA